MFKILMTSLLLGAALFAANPHQSMPAQQVPSVDINSLDKKEVQSFANALVKINELQQTLQSELPAKQEDISQEQLQKLSQKFQSEATKVIAEENLSVEKYEYYVQIFQSSPEFQKIVQSLLAKKS